MICESIYERNESFARSAAGRLIDKLEREHCLSAKEYEQVLAACSREGIAYIAPKARAAADAVYGKEVYVRGLIEFSNICKNNCCYCGIRRGNTDCERYRLSEEEILDCCRDGYSYGYRTFVLQSGEDPYYTDERICRLVREIKKRYPDCAVTLSIGEKEKESYRKYHDAGADRFLLRHETADADHYGMLHPAEMSFAHRMQCIRDLRETGFAVGIGMMIGSPYQTLHHLAEDLKFIEEFQPEMCGMGPFIPHAATPFADQPAGTLDMTLYLLSIVRLICPTVLLPATTALGTIDPLGREKGVLAGANVIMPNLSPVSVRKKYELYDNKICTGDESAQCRNCLDARMASVGYKVVVSRGDCRRERNSK